MTHACFKALLFLCAGVVIKALDGEHELHRMGGLRSELPLTFWTMVIGASSLAGLPLVTAGFYSKDQILFRAWVGGEAGPWLFAAGALGTLLTSLYIFRMVFLAFLGPRRAEATGRPGWTMRGPLIALAALSVVAGFVEMPALLGGVHLFSSFVQTSVPSLGAPVHELSLEAALLGLTTALSLAGLYVAYRLYVRPPRAGIAATPRRSLDRFWLEGWRFDALYDVLFVRPLTGAARANRADVIDVFYKGLAGATEAAHRGLRLSQNGRIRFYVAGIALGAVVLLALGLEVLQ
jgi:NADH-quinone oxidoreductase subunit L